MAHIIVDGPVDKPLIRHQFEKHLQTADGQKGKAPDDIFLYPDEVANQYWNLHTQHSSTWTLELDLRPFKEKIYSAL